MNYIKRDKIISGILVLTILLGTLACALPTIAASTIVSIPDASAGVGETVTVPINITNVTDLGAANIWLSYDKDVVIVDSVSPGDLGALTYSIDNPNGTTKIGWFSAFGQTGDFVYAYVTLQAVGNIGDTSPLDLDVKELVSSMGEPIEHDVVDGMFEVTGDLPPYLTEYTISNETISPDGDGIEDDTEIDVAFSESVDYAISIEKDGSVIYDWTGTAMNPSPKIWDGTYESNGSVVPNGVYTVNVTMDDGVNPIVYNNTETITVYVEESKLTKIEVLPDTATLNIGETQQFTAIGYDQYNNPMEAITFDWSSGNETVGTVDSDGLFMALAIGSTTVNATSGSVVGSAEVSVVPVLTTVFIGEVAAPPGGSVTTPIMILNVENVGVADITLSYNKSVVHVTDVDTSDFDSMSADIDNSNGVVRIAAFQMANPGLNGDVQLANVTLTAVGGMEESSVLGLSINELKEAGSGETTIPAIVDNGLFTISETTPPVVTDPTADPLTIPDDTDGLPSCGETSKIGVTVVDDSGIASVTVDLSALGGSTNQPMIHMGGDKYAVIVSASSGTLPGTYYLQVNATDVYGNSNTSVSIAINILKNGDVSENGEVTTYDAMYLAKHVIGVEGFEEMVEGVADVSGDCDVSVYDAMYLAKHVIGIEGFEVLH